MVGKTPNHRPGAVAIPFAKLLKYHRYKVAMPNGDWYSFEFLERLKSARLGFHRLRVREMFTSGPPAEWNRMNTPMAVRVDTVFEDLIQ